MKLLRPITIAALLPLAAAAQPQGQTSTGLPPGLVRQGDVVMMQPIGDSGTAATASIFAEERRAPVVRTLTAADHDAFARAVASGLVADWADARISAAQ